MVRILGDARFAGFGPLHTFAHNPTVANPVARFHLRFYTPTNQVIDLVWQNAGSEQVTMLLDPNRNATLINLGGARSALGPALDGISFTSSESPVYIVQNWQPGTRFTYFPFIGRN
jgi:hypothetical protein